MRLDRLAPADVEHLWSSMLDQGLSVAHCRGGLRVSEPKSAAGRRTLALPATLAAELRFHQAAQKVERLASEIGEPGPCGGWVFANPVGGADRPTRRRS